LPLGCLAIYAASAERGRTIETIAQMLAKANNWDVKMCMIEVEYKERMRPVATLR